MESRTLQYLEGRFGDHYRRSAVSLPPAANEREWGYIPWARGSRTTMIRHRSLMELGEINTFLESERPRHVYFSAGQYGDPAAGRMAGKEWRGSDLIFDLDADHLPDVDPRADAYREMLASCKRELDALLSFLERDFGFSELTIVFSGGRGYHVHVRDPSVHTLSRAARREIADYVLGDGVTLESVMRTAPVAGTSGRTPTTQRRLDVEAGWSRRVHREVIEYVDELLALDHEEALANLMEIEGIGEGRAAAILQGIDSGYDQLSAGNIDIHPAFVRVVDTVIERARARQGAAIDEPVTTDINRLIRLPGSLHGGSGLAVCRIERSDLAAFEPLRDAVPATFVGQEIAIDAAEPAAVELAGENHEIPEGLSRVPEYVGIHLMANERAEKAPETAV